MNRSRVTGDLASHGNIFVDIANDRVGIGSTIPGQKLSLPDSAKIALGNSADLEIYHDGSHSYIHDGGTGNLKLRSNNFRLSNADESKLSATFQASGAAELYHDNAKKLETTSTGVSVTGNVDAGTGGFLLSDDGRIRIGTGFDFELYHDGSHSIINDSAGSLLVRSNIVQISTPAGSKYFKGQSGVAELYHSDSSKLATTTYGIDVTGTTGTDGLTISGVTTFSASDTPGLQFTNATFGTKLYIGGYTGTTNSSNISRIRTSTGNLHIDSASNGGIYLNNYSSGDVYANGSIVLTRADEGSGNGIDADTLDGQEGSYYADAASYVKEIRTDDDITARMDSGFYETSSATTAEGWPETTNSHFHLISCTHSNTGNYHSLQIASSFSGQDNFYIRSTANSGTQAWSKIWTTSSDGTGSGLDADTLDGVQGSSFLRSDATDTASGAITFTNSALRLSGHWYSGFHANTTNYIHLFPQGHSGNATQTDIRAWNGSGSDVFRIIGGSATGLTWRGNTIWTAENDGGGSGLNADLVDGIQASSFLRSDAVDTATERINFNANATNNYDDMATSTGSQGAIEIYNSESGNDAFMAFHTGSDFALYFGLDADSNSLAVGGWSMGAVKHKIWHAGNDGTGSGLDADTLDGYQAVDLPFLRSDTTDAQTTGSMTFGRGGVDTDSFSASSGGFGNIGDGSGWGATGVFVHGGGTGDAAAMAHNGAALFFGIQDGANANSMQTWLQVTPNTRVINFTTANDTNNVQIGGNKVWHAGNDGAGSGLDADSVDGVGAGGFLRSDTDDICTHRIQFQNNATDNHDDIASSTGSQGGLEVYNSGSGNDAFMAFHTGGDFALYFGLDADTNRLAVGGWSMGAVKRSILHEKYATIRGSSAGDSFGITISMDGTTAPASVGHNSTNPEGIFWHTDDNNYAIYRTAGNWSGNYQQLRIDWLTGIILDGGSDYGLSGVRFDSHAMPFTNNTYDLGSSSLRWRNIYTMDLQLSNEGKTNDVDGTWGSYTIQEGEDDLFLINKRNGKKYKFNLTEVS